jgi:DNA-binding transcriptional regulator PaaX
MMGFLVWPDQGRAGLPFLHRFGLELFELIQDDPQLPLDVLPENWQGLKAFQQFGSYREDVYRKSESFILSILNGD